LRCGAIAVLAGALLSGLCAAQPSHNVLGLVLTAALVSATIRRGRPVAALLAGFALSGLAASGVLDERLDAARHGETWQLTVRIDDYPVQDGDALRFTARPIDRPELPARIRLTWLLPATAPGFGETWRLAVRLRRPHGYANPGGFDYEGWLFRERIGATGYVEEGARNYRIHGAPVRFVDRQRRAAVARIARLVPDDDAGAVLAAVVAGARHGISDERWEQFAATGTSHLMAISGLHVGLAAACAGLFAWLFAAVSARQSPRDWALGAALAAAAVYALVAGFAVPARRALAMLALAAIALALRRGTSPGRVLANAFLVLFIADPLSLLAPGFRLSFAAVAVLLLSVMPLRVLAPRAALHRRAAAAVRAVATMQLGLMLGLFPLTVTEFGRFTLLALPVNLAVLPLFNLVVVPFALGGSVAGIIHEPTGSALLGLAHHGATAALAVIDTARDLDMFAFANLPTDWQPAVMLPVLFVLLPSAWPGRRVAWLAVIAVLAGRPEPPPPGCFDYHVLDVGQGLAVVVRSRGRTLLYDTGPAFRNGGSAARYTVLPFLERLRVRKLDVVVVSHADLDHAGGVDDVRHGATVGRFYTGDRLAELGRAQSPCVSGIGWEWDGVRFEFLHPRGDSPWMGNNASCVLLVAAGQQRLLLPGDIEAPAEALLEWRRRLPRTAVTVVPHHGSRTSSSFAMVDSTQPALAIVSAGYRNRWDLPKPDVVARWQAVGARVVDTASSGAVSQRICTADDMRPVQESRRQSLRYWRDAPP